MDLALKNVELVLGELPRHPYKVKAKKSDDNTRSVVKLYRGWIGILFLGFLAGACLMTILCQRVINPWYKWNFHLEVDEQGKMGVKFSGVRNKVTYLLTCILGTCILAIFSSLEHKKIHRIVMETLQKTADTYFAENGLGAAPTVVDLNDKDDGKDDDEFLATEPLPDVADTATV